MNNTPTTVVCFAVKEEASSFRRTAAGRPGISILLTGMGKRNAENAVRTVLSSGGARLVITSGFAGGLNPDLAKGTVVFSVDPSAALAPGLKAAGARPARFHSVEEVVTTSRQKKSLYTSTGADAVDMESLFIQSVCREYDIPVAIVRVILDEAAEDLALDFNRVMTSDLRIDPRKLAIYLLKSPWKIVTLLKLRNQSAAAAKRLADVLSGILVL